MKKIILSSILFSSLVFSEQIRIIPIDKSYLAHENGGSKPAIDAYSDGVGIVTESKQIIDNSPMNTLVFTYGEKAKNNSSSLKNYSIENGSNEEKDLANKLGKLGELNNDIEGTACNDNNIQTINDKYVNGICVGTNVEGQSCDDNIAYTINDKYINGICAGINILGQTCNDGNAQTINDKYNSFGICIGTNVEGQTCNDGNVQTINDKYVNGICIGTNVEGQSCDDGNSTTTNDKYVNGVCIGTASNIQFNSSGWTKIAYMNGYNPITWTQSSSISYLNSLMIQDRLAVVHKNSRLYYEIKIKDSSYVWFRNNVQDRPEKPACDFYNSIENKTYSSTIDDGTGWNTAGVSVHCGSYGGFRSNWADPLLPVITGPFGNIYYLDNSFYSNQSYQGSREYEIYVR